MRGRLLAAVCAVVLGTACTDGLLPTEPTRAPQTRLEAIDPVCFVEVISPDVSMWVCK